MGHGRIQGLALLGSRAGRDSLRVAVGEHALREWAEGDDADSEVATGLNETVALDPAIEHRVRRLVDEQRHTHVAEDAGRLDRARRRVRRDAGVERLARVHRGGKRTHRLLERSLRVGPVVIEDVDVIETQPFKRLVQRGEDVLPRAQVAVGAGPHVPARLA